MHRDTSHRLASASVISGRARTFTRHDAALPVSLPSTPSAERPGLLPRQVFALPSTRADAIRGRIEYVHAAAGFALTKRAEAYERLPEFNPFRKLTCFFRSLFSLGFILEFRQSTRFLIYARPLARSCFLKFAMPRKTAPWHASTAHPSCNLLAQLHISIEFMHLLGTH